MRNGKAVTIPEFRKMNPELTSDWSVFDMVRQDLIPHHRIGRRVFVDLAMWERFKRAGGSSKPGEWRRLCGIAPEAA